MSIIKGTGGMVDGTGWTGSINSWAINIAVDELNVTTFDNADGGEDQEGAFMPAEGCKKFTFTFTGFADTDGAPMTSIGNGGYDVTVQFDAQAGNFYSGSGLVTNVAIGKRVCNACEVTWAGTFYGFPTFAWQG